MRTRILTILCLALLPLCLIQAKEKEQDDENNSKSKNVKVFTGFSGGVIIHGGYLFSDSPDKIFSNSGLGDAAKLENLRKDGVCIGFGAQFRVHFIDHIHLGAEAHTSRMPLMRTGSNVNSAWAGAFCDFYSNLGPVKPLIGLGLGGGQVKRLYVPEDAEVVAPGDGKTNYNASYVKQPFFYLDPYIGLECAFGLIGLQFKIDYMLPFGNPGSGLADAVKSVSWGNFLTPSGPRLHVALLLGMLK